jgi:predicted acyltransferase
MKPTLLLLALTSSLFAAERPEVTVPRQTSGDTAVQPTWEETLTITVGTMIGGIMCADWVRERDADNSRKLRALLIGGAVLVLGGELIGHSGLCPLVKRIWTTSFSLVSTGMCVLMLAAFYYIVDMRGWRRWTFPFIVAGANSIALYLMSQLLKPWVASLWQRYLGKDVFLIAGPEWESVLRYPAIGLTFWLVAWWMYRNNFFVRI